MAVRFGRRGFRGAASAIRLLSVTSIVAGVGSSSLAGLLFGFQPAYRASRLDPIVALQGE